MLNRGGVEDVMVDEVRRVASYSFHGFREPA